MQIYKKMATKASIFHFFVNLQLGDYALAGPVYDL
jgi:hypothetical protein